MTYAWISTLEVNDTADVDKLRTGLREEVIPQVSSLPGFQKGYWFQSTENQNAGAVVILFDSEEAARELRPPDDAPVTVHSRGLYRLTAEA